jgi:GTP-binding protein EngB required for normal cell division
MVEPSLELLTPFLGYLIIADGAIHTAEIDAMAGLLRDGVISAATQNELALIIADDDNKLPLETVLQRLAAADLATQEQSLVAALVITYSDGFLDLYEEQLIEAFLAKTGFSHDRYLALREQAQHTTQPEPGRQAHSLVSLLSATLRPLVHRLAAVGPQASRERFERLGTRLLLAGPDYERAIERCAVVAREDFAVAAGYLMRGNEQIIQLSRDIAAMMQGIVQRPELQEIDVRATLAELRGSINERLVTRVERQREALIKRQRAIDSYTIAFVGRTKAGKSTLHAVITGEGDEAIGVGLQRTTRYNRVYAWKRLRIIDTPGIGAPGGQSDEGIAESILDESDVICYVVTNDSIQEAEFQFLAGIRKRGKPVVILLNVKENIADERRLRIYLKNPHRWYERADEQGLQGHIDRIRRYAKTFYRSDHMPIFPVHLLAARLSRDEAHRSHAATLYQSSRLQAFLDACQVGLIEEGPLRRSQTMLDGTIHTLDATRADLANLVAPLQDLRERLTLKRAHLNVELQRSATRAKTELQQIVSAAFDRLVEGAYPFARDHHNDSASDCQKAWERELQRRGFVRLLQDEIMAAYQGYFATVRSFLDEATADLEAFADLRISAFTPDAQPTRFDLRMAANIGSIVAGVGGTIAGVLALAGIAIGPVGWICAAAAVGFGFLGNFFERKSEKRQKAIQRLYESLCKGIAHQKEQTQQQVLDGLEQTQQDVAQRIVHYFNALTSALDNAITALTHTERSLAADTEALNHAFASRLLAFALQQPVGAGQSRSDVVDVRRDIGTRFTIFTPHSVDPATAERLSAIVQEQMIFAQPAPKEALYR